MKKKLLGMIAVTAIAIFAGYNVYISQNNVELSELALSNIEALADPGESSATCTFGNVTKDQYTNTLHCTGNGSLCCKM